VSLEEVETRYRRITADFADVAIIVYGLPVFIDFASL